MRVLGIVIAVLVILTGVFAAANWPELTATGQPAVSIGTRDFPAGLVLATLLTTVAAALAVELVWMRGRMLIEQRRLQRELAAQRELAQSAETSRVAALESTMRAELARLSSTVEESGRSVRERLDQLAAARGALPERPMATEQRLRGAGVDGLDAQR